MAAQMFEKEGQKEESDAARPHCRSKVGNLYFSAVIERHTVPHIAPRLGLGRLECKLARTDDEDVKREGTGGFTGAASRGHVRGLLVLALRLPALGHGLKAHRMMVRLSGTLLSGVVGGHG